MTPPCWRCSTAKSTPARPTPIRRTATTPPGCAILKNSEDVKKIRAIAFSEPIPADNLVISANLDATLAKKIETTFIELSRDPAGKKMLRELYQIDGFVPATDKDYDSVRQAFADAGIPDQRSPAKKTPVTILEIRDLHHSYNGSAPVLRRYYSPSRTGRICRHHRTIGRGKIDLAALHQPPGRSRFGRDKSSAQPAR